MWRRVTGKWETNETNITKMKLIRVGPTITKHRDTETRNKTENSVRD